MFKIRAKSTNGKGKWGKESERMTSSACPPDPVPVPIIECVEERSIGVTWTRPPCRGDPVTMYELSHLLPGTSWRTMGNWKTEIRTSATFYGVSKLVPASSHSFRLRAYNSLGWGEYGIQSPTVKTEASIPAPPEAPKLGNLQPTYFTGPT